MAEERDWDLRPGDPIRRAKLHDRFGGNRQGGISPSARSPHIFVFTGPSGLEHGYKDRVKSDGLFHYVGQGRTGDQRLERANLQLRDHRRLGMTIRVFRGVEDVVTYVGEFEVDAVQPTYWDVAPSTGAGPMRKVLVFRLNPRAGSRTDLLPAGDSEREGMLWTAEEMRVAVRAYVDLLLREMQSERYDRDDVLRELGRGLGDRSAASVAELMQQISFVLEHEGFGWLEELDPLTPESQGLRPLVVAEARSSLSDRFQAFEDAAVAAPSTSRLTTDDLLVPPPSSRARQKKKRSGVRVAGSQMSAMRDFQQRQLGRAGEDLVVGLEIRRLKAARRDKLADRVRWVAKLDGDGMGYDIRSYWPDGRERWIEVKTTNNGVLTPFYITSWEVDVSREHPDKYSLYRVHSFSRDARLYVLDGSVDVTSQLEPRVFMGLPR